MTFTQRRFGSHRHEAVGSSPAPRIVGDIVYSLRYRVPLPDSIRRTAPSGPRMGDLPRRQRRLHAADRALQLSSSHDKGLRTIRLPDATPGVISKYALTDEQALLARVRYNRLLDVFTGLACYPLQSHLRTSITITNAIDGTPSSSQVETDDVYVGLDEHGAHYILPVQAKGGSDSLSVIQIWQDLRVAEQKFPDLIARPVAAQFMEQSVIALFEFQESNNQITIAREHHYSLVPPEELESHELAAYRTAAQHATP